MHNQATTPWIKKGMLLLLIVGTLLRLVYAARPFDQRIMTSWRQADYVQIARNYDREGMNILYPRIDWRGNSPGYVEAEFPLVPWLGAAMYRIFGYHENLLRVAPCVFSILTLFLFGWLARKELPQEGALAATAFFALNPLLFYLSTAIQPESLMLFMVVLGYACIRLWEAQPAVWHLLPASLVAGGAILAKTPAASLGLLLGYAVLKKLGWRTFTQPGIYLAALAGLLPPLAWYAWAHSFWLEYGNSLGISNESHFIGLDILFPPTFLAGNLKWETLWVFTPPGWLLLLAALLFLQPRYHLMLAWYGMVWIFYLLAARTSGDAWSYYYHCSSIPAACLLMGAGCSSIPAGRLNWKRWVPLLCAGVILSEIALIGRVIWQRDFGPLESGLGAKRQAALQFAPQVGPDEKILVEGGEMSDEKGHPVAFNDPMFFAWMDRRGFNHGIEEFSLETLEKFRLLGARYWIGRIEFFRQHNPDEADKVKQAYPLVAEGPGGYGLYRLADPKAEQGKNP